MYLIELLFYQNDLDNTTLKKNPMSTEHISIEETIVVVVSTGKITQLLFVRSNHKTVWNDYLQLDV